MHAEAEPPVRRLGLDVSTRTLLRELSWNAVSQRYSLRQEGSSEQQSFTALDQALARAARFLMRLWRRGSDPRRMRQRFIGHEH